MKINFNSFDCKVGTVNETMVLVNFDNYKDFVKKFQLDKCEFMPDFMGQDMQYFLFLKDGINWEMFITNLALYANYESRIWHKEQPFHINLDFCYPCNQRMLDYLYYPERRMDIFLYESRNHDSAKQFCDDLYAGLRDPKICGGKSLESFKVYWQKCLGTKRYANFPTRYYPILVKLSNWFPKTYRWVYQNIIETNSFFSSRFHNDFISRVNFSTQKFDECEFNNCELPF